jgi:putative oxidoreductase
MKKLDTTLLITRVLLGTVVLAHGVQKIFGWFGGYGYNATMDFFTQQIGLPAPLAFLTIIAETLGMLLLIAGIFGRYLAASVIVIMLGAIVTVHGANGFYMNWAANQPGEGFEFHLLLVGMAIVITILGTGAYSLDRYFFKKKRHIVPDNFSIRQ